MICSTSYWQQSRAVYLACEILGITKLDSHVQLPPNVKHGMAMARLATKTHTSSQVVEHYTLAFTDEKVWPTPMMPNTTMLEYYAIVVQLLLWNNLDSSAEGNGE